MFRWLTDMELYNAVISTLSLLVETLILVLVWLELRGPGAEARGRRLRLAHTLTPTNYAVAWDLDRPSSVRVSVTFAVSQSLNVGTLTWRTKSTHGSVGPVVYYAEQPRSRLGTEYEADHDGSCSLYYHDGTSRQKVLHPVVAGDKLTYQIALHLSGPWTGSVVLEWNDADGERHHTPVAVEITAPPTAEGFHPDA
jgi:hypothetical protein